MNGPIPRPVDFAWVWGDALPALDAAAPDVRIINLETSITTSDEFAVGKAVLYRMNPANIPALTAVRPDVCVLANNHVLDFGRTGLAETLDLARRRRSPGTGSRPRHRRGPPSGRGPRSRRPPRPGLRRRAWRPAASRRTGPRPRTARGWTSSREPSAAAADEVVERVRTARRPGDVVVVSVHWGGNWGYGVSSGGDRVRAPAGRRRGGRRARTLVTPSAPDRGVPRQAHPLRLRRLHRRLRGHRRPRAVPGRPAPALPGDGRQRRPAAWPRCGWSRCRRAGCG